MDRREFLSLGSVAALLPTVPASASALQSGGASGDAQLNAAFDQIFNEQVRAFIKPNIACPFSRRIYIRVRER